MPDYEATFWYRGADDSETSKKFAGTFADDAAANTAWDALQTDLAAATSAHIYKRSLAKVEDVAGAPGAGSTVFNTVSATVNLTGKSDKANMQFPAPVAAMMSGNALIIAGTEWTNLIANFASGAGWTVSDGDTVDTTVSGKRVYRKSGKTNLPV